MDVSLEPVPYEQKSLLRNLLELAQHDYSEFNGKAVGRDGLFGYRYLDHYWTEEGRHALLVRADGEIAGFALVRPLPESEVPSSVTRELPAGPGTPTRSLAEFLVLRKFRRKGIGRRAVLAVLDALPGRWHVSQEPGNEVATRFWRSVLSEHVDGGFIETREDGWPTQWFTTT
jgi:predicted acetyltransferase